MKKRDIILTCILLVITIGVMAYIALRDTDDDELKGDTLFDSSYLVEDYYVYNDVTNDIIYEHKIYVPKYMTKSIQTDTIATYNYRDDDTSLSLQYSNLKDRDEFEKSIGKLNCEKEDFYYIYKSDKYIAIYFENSYEFYQAIDITLVSDTKKLDDSYKNLLKNLSTTQKSYKDYALKKENGYYVGTIINNYYNNEEDRISVSADYKVSAEKYGSVYNPDYEFLEAYLDKSGVSFYEGEITADLDTVQKQTRIRMYTSKILNLDIEKEAVEDLKWPVNQPAFNNVTKDKVKIKFDSFEYRGKEVNYYKTTSSNNNSYGERIYAYYPITDNIYYVIQIFGGVDKELNAKGMIEEFLPTTSEYSGVYPTN